MGYWRTVRGRKVYFEDGDDIETALKRSKEYSKKKNKADEDDTSSPRDAAAYYLKKGEFHKFDQYIQEGGLEDEKEEFLATAGYGIKKDYEEYKARKNFEKAATTEVKTEQDLQNQINAWNKYKAAGGNEEKLAKSVEERHKQELNKQLEKSAAWKEYNNQIKEMTSEEYNKRMDEQYRKLKDKKISYEEYDKTTNDLMDKYYSQKNVKEMQARTRQNEEAKQSPLQKSISSLNKIDDLANEATNYTKAYNLEKLQKMGRQMGRQDFEKFVNDLKASKNRSLSEINSEFNRAESNWANAQTTAERVKWSREASRLSALREEAYDREEARIKSNTAKKTNETEQEKRARIRRENSMSEREWNEYIEKQGIGLPDWSPNDNRMIEDLKARKEAKTKDAYKKYLKEHPNSKLKYEDFKKFVK